MTLREMLLTTPHEQSQMSIAKMEFFNEFIETGDLDMIRDPIFDIDWVTPVQLTITTCVLMYLCYDVIGPYGFTEDTEVLNQYDDTITTESGIELLGPVRGKTIQDIQKARTIIYTQTFPEWFKDKRTFLPEKYIVVNRRGFLRRLKVHSLPEYFRERNLYLIPD